MQIYGKDNSQTNNCMKIDKSQGYVSMSYHECQWRQTKRKKTKIKRFFQNVGVNNQATDCHHSDFGMIIVKCDE